MEADANKNSVNLWKVLSGRTRPDPHSISPCCRFPPGLAFLDLVRHFSARRRQDGRSIPGSATHPWRSITSPNDTVRVGGEPPGNKKCKGRNSCIQDSREMQIQQLCCRIGSKCFSLALSKSWLWVVWLRVAVFLARLDKLFGLACQLFACSFQNRLGRQCRHGTPLPTQNSSN